MNLLSSFAVSLELVFVDSQSWQLRCAVWDMIAWLPHEQGVDRGLAAKSGLDKECWPSMFQACKFKELMAAVLGSPADVVML